MEPKEKLKYVEEQLIICRKKKREHRDVIRFLNRTVAELRAEINALKENKNGNITK